MTCTTAQIMDFIHTKCSLVVGKKPRPFASYPLVKISQAIQPFANKNLGSKITAGIVLEIIGLISLPFMLIEVFFKALVFAFVLLGVAIKSALDKDMENFKNLSSTTGKVLLSNIKTICALGFASGLAVADC